MAGDTACVGLGGAIHYPDPAAAAVPRPAPHRSTRGCGRRAQGQSRRWLADDGRAPGGVRWWAAWAAQPLTSFCLLPSSWLSSTSSPCGCRLLPTPPPMDVDSDSAAGGKPTQMDLGD
uniref:Uncharacterized protein n=1 Tax=Oryza rufipogon TaxID=4529 RepID=A0A0E0PXK0_ORYRU